MKRIVLLLGAWLLAGCQTQSPPQLASQVEAFAAQDGVTARDRVFVAPGVELEHQTIEHRIWARLAVEQLTRRGITVVNAPADATVTAIVTLSIDSGRDVTSTFAVPQFGVVGHSNTQTFGTINRLGNTSTFNATTVQTPQFGVTGYTNSRGP